MTTSPDTLTTSPTRADSLTTPQPLSSATLDLIEQLLREALRSLQQRAARAREDDPGTLEYLSWQMPSRSRFPRAPK